MKNLALLDDVLTSFIPAEPICAISVSSGRLTLRSSETYTYSRSDNNENEKKIYNVASNCIKEYTTFCHETGKNTINNVEVKRQVVENIKTRIKDVYYMVSPNIKPKLTSTYKVLDGYKFKGRAYLPKETLNLLIGIWLYAEDHTCVYNTEDKYLSDSQVRHKQNILNLIKMIETKIK